MKFWRDFASYPFQSHELWFLTENIRWGKLDPKLDTKALIARSIARICGATRRKRWPLPAAEIPASTSRGKETLFDGKVFDPENRPLICQPRDQAHRPDAGHLQGDDKDERALQAVTPAKPAFGIGRWGRPTRDREAVLSRETSAARFASPCCRRGDDRHPARHLAAARVDLHRRCRRRRRC